MIIFGGVSVSAESEQLTFGRLSVSAESDLDFRRSTETSKFQDCHFVSLSAAETAEQHISLPPSAWLESL